MPDYTTNWRSYLARMRWRLRVAERRYRAARALRLTSLTRQQALWDWGLGTDEQALTYYYALNNDHLPDLRTPVWLNEKIRWQFLNHPNPLMSLAADKVAVRDYLRYAGTTIAAPDLVAVGNSPEEFLRTPLPRRFVLKSTHGSAQLHIEDGAGRACRARLATMIGEWNRCDWWRQCGELHYRGIPKRWMVEEYVPARQEKLEYKIFCFMGEPRFITVITERDGTNFRRVTMDLDWNRVSFTTRGFAPDPRTVAPPPELDTILAEARRLAQPFLHVRVDFLKFDGRLVFSELTFAAMGALVPFEPIEANREIGALMDLSQSENRLAQGRRIARRLGWTDSMSTDTPDRPARAGEPAIAVARPA